MALPTNQPTNQGHFTAEPRHVHPFCRWLHVLNWDVTTVMVWLPPSDSNSQHTYST